MNLYDTPFENKDVEWRFGHFRKIAKTGIQICLFCSPDNKDYLENFVKEFPNIRIMDYISIKDTWSYNLVSMLSYPIIVDGKEVENPIELPANRNMPKDTVEYICMMHSKVEFLNTAIQSNPFGSTHFAWIDFNVAYIFKDNLYVEEYLRVLAQRTFAADFLAIPGCWDKQKPETCLLDNICWRFCGGFFIGSKARVEEFYQKYLEYFPMFLETHRKLIWEVNFWAWLESNTDWTPPIWYKGDHNDSIIQITTDICNRCLCDNTYSKTSYFYPPVETYLPSSASHVIYKGQHILNTRYVNYWYRPSGHCNIIHAHNWIISKNFLSILHLNEEDKTLEPTDFIEMDDNSIGLKSHDASFFGLEDIRLYVLNDELRFICTNINYSPTGRNRMITGKYDIDTTSFLECRVLHPPNKDSWCEKNWIPLTRNVVDEELFIYKWWPFEVGKVNKESDQLEIILSYKINSPLFMKVRGSTAFIETDEGLLGLVHYSEDTLPRHYYHIMVLLDKTTFQPLKYSDVFCFEKIGIEFCIGFWQLDGEYHFWISRMDRDPLYLKMDKDSLPLKFNFSIL
jgi:predicted GH43/DUF377 family glycosyl hydrolase